MPCPLGDQLVESCSTQGLHQLVRYPSKVPAWLHGVANRRNETAFWNHCARERKNVTARKWAESGRQVSIIYLLLPTIDSSGVDANKSGVHISPIRASQGQIGPFILTIYI